MIVLRVLLTVLTVVLTTQVGVAQKEASDPSPEEQFQEIAKLGPGVHKVVKDKKGRITSCVVVGQARISTVLGKAKGLELARDKASLECSAQFVKWLKEEVRIAQTSDEESVVLIAGSEKGDDESLEESGKSIEKSSKRMEAVSQGLVRGLVLIYRSVDGDEKNYIVIKGWKADTAEAVKKISADMTSDKPANKSSGSKDKAKGKDIESSSAISDDAGDFLPKRQKAK